MAPAYISVELRQQLRADAGQHCGYCRSSELVTGIPLEVEHIIPESLGGPTSRQNLWLTCHRCNQFKGDRIYGLDPLTGKLAAFFNPRIQRWPEHFAWSSDGTLIIGLTASGRVTVIALQLNNTFAVNARRLWVNAGWWPPND